jgi:hypothetical protein
MPDTINSYFFLQLLLILSVTMVTNAFSSIPVDMPYPKRTRPIINKNNKQAVIKQQQQEEELVVAATPWRIVLDIGREPLAAMPLYWARSGCRMPLAIPCDFAATGNGHGNQNNNNQYLVLPRSDTVSFTGPDGAVVKPVVGGTWELSDDKKYISFTLSFPETLQRRDVTIDAGTTLQLTSRLYTQRELDQLNEAYYKARENTWQVGSVLNDIANQRVAAKKWNEETKRWEQPRTDGNMFGTFQKRFDYWMRKVEQGKRNQDRPAPSSISDRGELPGLDGGVYIAKGGLVRASSTRNTGKTGPVMGTWQAQPITKLPVSYRKA